ncbi:GLPGLI family protein [Psychroflexus lacisalsi]|jgi:GLPGLI family protein|uniref:GLPGLI family protein n=1 Tax=Psychroflexus lacisalsi TaxID=503928 RepID=A0ABN1K2I2_9FLAO|nr:GLPGLI family protein [Psychroflexus lacisalsi]MBZ9618613.1 GLPGLI family protein [Psychroflexus lacisalsi]
MSKKTSTLLFILLFINSVVLSQNNSGEILYGQSVEKFYIDTTSIDNSDLKSIIITQFKEKQNALSPDKNFYSLKFQGSKSVFERLTMMNNDGSNKVTKELAKGIYFVNIVDKSIYHKGDFMGENLIIYHEKPSYDEWEIINEQKMIRGYNCIKAETIRQNEIGVKTKVTAWFSTDINLNFGPKNYFGLPGLIIELHELGSVYYVREINLKEVKLDEVDIDDKEIITYDEYVKKANGSIRF